MWVRGVTLTVGLVSWMQLINNLSHVELATLVLGTEGTAVVLDVLKRTPDGPLRREVVRLYRAILNSVSPLPLTVTPDVTPPSSFGAPPPPPPRLGTARGEAQGEAQGAAQGVAHRGAAAPPRERAAQEREERGNPDGHQRLTV
ncbi:hypothetical protein T484DRAFT_1900243 [Baffinella frigidus]|nr:hypothetical protein T484DRAFT_1900243 [Cryptophyta sp. CCMP2293]